MPLLGPQHVLGPPPPGLNAFRANVELGMFKSDANRFATTAHSQSLGISDEPPAVRPPAKRPPPAKLLPPAIWDEPHLSSTKFAFKNAPPQTENHIVRFIPPRTKNFPHDSEADVGGEWQTIQQTAFASANGPYATIAAGPRMQPLKQGDRSKQDMATAQTNFGASFVPDATPKDPVRVTEAPTGTIKGDRNLDSTRRFTTTTNDANEAIRNNRIPHPGVLPREVTSKLRGWSSLAEGNKNAPQHQQPRETIAFTSMKDANHYQLASPGSNPRSKEMFRTNFHSNDGLGFSGMDTTQSLSYAGAVARRPPAHQPASNQSPLNENTAYVITPAVPITYTHFRGARGPPAVPAITVGAKGHTHIRDGDGERRHTTVFSSDYRRWKEGGASSAKPDFSCHVAPWHIQRGAGLRAAPGLQTNSAIAFPPQPLEPRDTQLAQMRLQGLKRSYIKMPATAPSQGYITTNRAEIREPTNWVPTVSAPRQHTGSVIIR